jgi:hypothetical protein
MLKNIDFFFLFHANLKNVWPPVKNGKNPTAR